MDVLVSHLYRFLSLFTDILDCVASASQFFGTLVEHVSPDAGSTMESRMYPRVDSLALLHSHIAAAPYIRRSHDENQDSTAAGLSLNVWQDPNDTCGVQAISVRVNWVTSLGLMVMRYRMTMLAWMMGLGAIVVSAQYRQYRLNGMPFSCRRMSRFDLAIRRFP